MSTLVTTLAVLAGIIIALGFLVVGIPALLDFIRGGGQ